MIKISINEDVVSWPYEPSNRDMSKKRVIRKSRNRTSLVRKLVNSSEFQLTNTRGVCTCQTGRGSEGVRKVM